MPTARTAEPGTSEPPASQQLSTCVARTPDELERHLDAWEDLVAHAAEPNPFFEPHALLAAWRNLAASELQVVLVWASHPRSGRPPVLGGLFPVVPLRRYRGLPLPGFQTWTHLYSYLATPLVRDELAQDVLEALFVWLRTQTSAAVFAWRTIGSDGPFRHALIETLNHLGFETFRERAHTRALFRPAATAEAYLARAITGKKRRMLQRQERRLAELGQVRYDELAADGDLDAWVDEFVALEQGGWKGRGGTALGCDPAALAVFRAMARGAFQRGRWLMLALRLDGRAIAMKCSMRAGAGAVVFRIAYDEGFASSSPGVLLEIEHLRRLHDPGALAWLDSGAAPHHPMFDRLWHDRLVIETLVSPTGRAPGALAVAALPLARWLAHTVRDAAQRVQRRIGRG